MSNCCNKSGKDAGLTSIVSRGISRRAVLKRLAAVSGSAAALSVLPAYGKSAADGLEKIKLAFCSQLLCVVPYEVTRAAGFFEEQGLDVDLIYSRGGSAAMQALHSGGVDYAATSLDAAIGAFSHGANITRFANTGRLPLFAMATSPKMAGKINTVADLQGKTVGVAQLGNADHALTLYLLKKNNIDPDTVQFATLGPNLFDALRVGQVDAGMVQEPGLTLIQEQGGRLLVNLMDIDDAREYLGGAYAFMGVSVRADEIEQRKAQMQKVGRALANGIQYLKQAPIADVIDALPKELVAGDDTDVLTHALDLHRQSLYSSNVEIDRDACERVIHTQVLAGIREEGDIDLDRLLTTSILSS